MFGSNFRDFVSQDPAEIKDERLTKSCPEFGKLDSGDSGNCSETEEGKSSDREAVLTPQDDNSLIQSLIGNIGEGPKSFIIEGDEEESFVIAPKNLTFTEMKDILNGKIDDIQDYENRLITDLGDENFKNLCLDQLNLKLEDQRIKNVEERQSKTRSDHQHIYSNILSKYKRNMENGNHGYSVKELLLLAIAANDRLAEEYQRVLFAEENLSLLPLLVGGQKYIEIFIEKFPDLYQSLKEQTIKTQFGQVNFFSAIALRKEWKLLNGVFFIAGGKFQDLKEILQQRQSISDSLYGIFETASLVQNIGFINIVLNSIKTDARETDDQEKKDLFKSSFITLLETAISQEHVSIVEHLCKRCTENKDPVIQQIYKEAFADGRVVNQFDVQVVSRIKNDGNNGARKEKEEVYNLILKTASQTGNIEFIAEVLKLIENDPQLSSDQDKQVFLQDSLITILGSAVGAKSDIIIKNLCTRHSDSIIKALGNKKEGEEAKKLAAKNILDNVENLMAVAVMSKKVDNLKLYVNILESSVAHAQPGETLVKRIQEVVNNFAKEHDKAWRTYVDGSAYAFLQKTMGYISHADYKIVEDLIPRLNNLRKLLEDRKDITTSPVEEQLTFPVATNSAEPEGDSSKQAGGNVLETKKENDTINSIEVLTQKSVRNNFISNCKEGIMGRSKKSGFNSKCSRTKQPTSGKGVPIESEKRTKKAASNEKLLNTQANSNATANDQAAASYAQPVVVITSNGQATASGAVEGQSTENSSAKGVGDNNGTNTCVDPNVTIPEDRKDSGCGSGSSTPEIPEKAPVLHGTHAPEASDEKQIINKCNEEGFTLLHVAALKGDVNEGKHLIGLGANIEITTLKSNQTNNYGDTALHLAAQKGHKGFVKLLLDRGADANSASSTESGVTPLHEAAYNGHVDVVDLLIEHGAKIDAGDWHNFTPLMYASANGKLKVVELLLQKEANPCFQNKDSETALHSAAGYGYLDVVSILINKAKDKKEYVNTQGVIGTALHVIAYNREINEGHKKVIKLLLDNGAGPYLKNNPKDLFSEEEDSLTMARRRGNTEFIEFMISLDFPPQVAPTEASAPVSGGNAPGAAEPDKTSKNAQKSKLPTIAAFTLTAAAVVSVALSVYFEMLAVGIAVGFCCLAVAAVIYCCSPKSSVERNNVTHVADTKTVS